MRTNNYKEGLIEAIKVAGQMMIDNAEDIAGKTELMSSLNISVEFDPEMRSIPEMTIRRSHLPSVENIDRIFDIFNKKEYVEPVVCHDCGKVSKDHPDLRFFLSEHDYFLCKECKNKSNCLVKEEVRR